MVWSGIWGTSQCSELAEVPCKVVAPVLEDLSKEYEGKVNIFKIDTEKQQENPGKRDNDGGKGWGRQGGRE